MREKGDSKATVRRGRYGRSARGEREKKVETKAENNLKYWYRWLWWDPWVILEERGAGSLG